MEYFTVNEINGEVSAKKSLIFDTHESYSVCL